MINAAKQCQAIAPSKFLFERDCRPAKNQANDAMIPPITQCRAAKSDHVPSNPILCHLQILIAQKKKGRDAISPPTQILLQIGPRSAPRGVSGFWIAEENATPRSRIRHAGGRGSWGRCPTGFEGMAGAKCACAARTCRGGYAGLSSTRAGLKQFETRPYSSSLPLNFISFRLNFFSTFAEPR
jgi:hypothetical protein